MTSSEPVNNCLICNTQVSESPLLSAENSRNKNNWPSISNNILPCPELESFFTIRHALDVPEDLCKYFLQIYGNPSEWGVHTCTNCSIKYIDKLRTIQIQIQTLEDKRTAIKKEVSDVIKQNFSGGHFHISGANNNAVQKVHDWIIDSGTPEFVIKQENIEEVDYNNDFEYPGFDYEADQEDVDFIVPEWKLQCDLQQNGNENEPLPYRLETIKKEKTNKKSKAPKRKKSSVNKTIKTEVCDQTEEIPKDVETIEAPTKRLRKRSNIKFNPESDESDSERIRNNRDGSDPDFELSDSDVSLHGENVTGLEEGDELTVKKESKKGTWGKKRYPCLIRKCRKLGTKFRDQVALDAHHCKVHEKREDTFKCHICITYFKTRELLIKHTEKEHIKMGESASTSTSTFIQQCECCRKTYLSPESLENHTTWNKFPCETCGIETCSLKGLRLHVKETHPAVYAEKMKAKFQCNECGKVLLSDWGFKLHMEFHEDPDKPPAFTCEFCAQAFRRKQNLLEHQKRKHMPELNLEPEKFPCNECERVFASKVSLKNHVVMAHSKLFKYLCSQCGKGYNMPRSFREHMKSHSEDRPEVCHICSNTFKSKLSLYRHIQLHTAKAERKYICNVCDKAFTSSTKLKTHLNIHSGLTPYECKICQVKFPVKNYLYCHNRTHHPKPDGNGDHGKESRKVRQKKEVQNQQNSEEQVEESQVFDGMGLNYSFY